MASNPSAWQTWLRLSRVSNLPTVWTNTGAAFVLSAAPETAVGVAWLTGVMLLISVLYVAGMILNDAFDADYDTQFRPTRPIPTGAVTRSAAWGVGFLLLGIGVIGITLVGAESGRHYAALTASLALATTIVVYDAYHKHNPMSPVLMGACRGLVYVTVAQTMGTLGAAVLCAAALQVAYVVGLTYAAKQEDLAAPGSWWPLGLLLLVAAYAGVVAVNDGFPDRLLVGLTLCGYLGWLVYATRPLFATPRRIGEGVGRLIAGIAAVDAVLLAVTGSIVATGLAVLALGITRVFHRVIPGT